MQEALLSPYVKWRKQVLRSQKMSKKGLPYISVLPDPTMGGVSASLAMLGDVYCR